jgi:capsule polysaccharide export protein KpsE/RkpR
MKFGADSIETELEQAKKKIKELEEQIIIYQQKTGEFMDESKVDIVTSYILKLESELAILKGNKK